MKKIFGFLLLSSKIAIAATSLGGVLSGSPGGGSPPILPGSGITFVTNNGIITISTTNVSTILTQTNFVLNTVYTNGSQSLLVSASAGLTVTGVSGEAALDLMVDQLGGVTFAIQARNALATTASTVAESYTNVIMGIIAPSGTYYFTNSSIGAGDSSRLIAGTGQTVTISSGTNGAAGVAGATGATGPQGPAGNVSTNLNNIWTGSNNFQGGFSISGTSTNTSISGNVNVYNLTATNLVTSTQYAGTQVNISAANIDWLTGTHFWKIIAANTTFTFTNTNDTYQVIVAITGDASHTVTWTGVKWAAGSAPTQTLSKTDIYTFVQMNGTNYGSVVQNF